MVVLMVRMVRMGNGVHAPGVPGVTASHTPECQPAAFDKPMGFKGFGPIGRTAGIKPASGRQQR